MGCKAYLVIDGFDYGWYHLLGVTHIQANNKGNWNETGDVKVSVLIIYFGQGIMVTV